MTSAHIWTSSTYHEAFRCGGWAYVRLVDGERSGAAGGDRGVGAWRTALAGLTAALKGVPDGADVTIHSPSPALKGLGALLSTGVAPKDLAPQDMPAWTAFTALASARKLSFVRSSPDPRTPAAFAQAWADLARDKAKAQGAFSSPIPKVNLAKLAGLGG